MTTDTQIDPVAFLREIERAWQARDGKAAAASYSDDAVLIFGNGQSRTGEELRAWPQRWFDFAVDLEIEKRLCAFSDNCLAGEWESRYTHPETGQIMLERGAEFFWLRGTQIYLHHMFEHTWIEGEGDGGGWPAV